MVGKGRWTTASRLDRAALCPGSTVLPEERTKPGNSAIWGSAWHQVVEQGTLLSSSDDGEPWPAWVVKGVADKLSNISPVWRDQWPVGGAHELRGELDGDDIQVAACLGKGEKWNERPTGIRIKADYIGMKLGEPWVDDLKTGRFADEPTSLQVGAAALLVATLKGAEGVWGSITHWTRYPKGNEPEREWHYYDADALDQVRLRLRTIRADALGPAPTFRKSSDEYDNPTNQCLWCSSRKFCPQWD